jgi:nicotinate-nucleotide adenylyltransferase
LIKIKKCAIYGGTFDPIHNGHLHLVKELIHGGEFEKVIIVPAGLPSQKEAVASAKDRLEMTKLGVSEVLGSNYLYEVNDSEIERSGPSFAIDTATEISNRYPEYEIYWIIGSDIVANIAKWHRFGELAKIVKFLIIERPGFKLSEYPADLKFDIREIEAKDISASEIRNLINNGKDISTLVPQSVLHYIRQNRLYGAA